MSIKKRKQLKILVLDLAGVRELVIKKLSNFLLDLSFEVIDTFLVLNQKIKRQSFSCLLVTYKTYSEKHQQAIERFLEQRPNIPLIVMSKKQQKQKINRLFHLGVDTHLELEDFQHIDLFLLIEQSMGRHDYLYKLKTSEHQFHQLLELLDLQPVMKLFEVEGQSVGGSPSILEINKKIIHHVTQAVNFDRLTQVHNRNYFELQLRRHLSQNHRLREIFHLFIVNLDRFKIVNEIYGHNVGDLLLKEASQRMLLALRGVNILARLGGDEFAIIASGIKNIKQAKTMANRLVRALNRPYLLNQHKICSSASIGIARFDANQIVSFNAIMKSADLALYRAKVLGRNRFEYFAKSFGEIQRRAINIEIGLRIALKNREFSMDYQPIVDLDTGQVHHFEALIRWNSSYLKEWVSPMEFIEIAENMNLITEVTHEVLHLVCQMIRRHLIQNQSMVPIAINFSVIDIMKKGFVNYLDNMLDDYHLNAAHIQIELTETSFMKHHQAIEKTIKLLRKRGYYLSIDDFGSGYSSLSRLREVHFDGIKIDRGFIINMMMDPIAMQIIRVILDLCRQLGMVATAEGVEREEELEALKQLDCRYAQGFYFSKPLLESEINGYLHKMAKKNPPYGGF